MRCEGGVAPGFLRNAFDGVFRLPAFQRGLFECYSYIPSHKSNPNKGDSRRQTSIAPRRASVSLSPTFFIAKTQQQRFKLTKCLLLIGPDRLEDDTGAAIQIGSKHFQ